MSHASTNAGRGERQLALSRMSAQSLPPQRWLAYWGPSRHSINRGKCLIAQATREKGRATKSFISVNHDAGKESVSSPCADQKPIGALVQTRKISKYPLAQAAAWPGQSWTMKAKHRHFAPRHARNTVAKAVPKGARNRKKRKKA